MQMPHLRCLRDPQRLALYQGMTFSRAVKVQTELGFRACVRTTVLTQNR